MSSKFLYHGSTIADIKTLIPQIRYTPAFLDNKISPAIYASKDKAYSACHSFPWSTEEGFNLYIQNTKIVFEVPKIFKKRLKQNIYIYKLSRDNFELMKTVAPYGFNFWSKKNTKVVSVEKYKNVEEAIIANNGIIYYK